MDSCANLTTRQEKLGRSLNDLVEKPEECLL